MATLREVKKRINTVKSTKRGNNAKKLIAAVVFALILLGASSTNAFDGNRKGFVLGGGLGISPYSSWSAEGTFGAAQVVSHFHEGGAGLGMNVLFGYAWDARNMIVFEVNGLIKNSEELQGDPTIGQSINGTTWYHYYGQPGRSLFTVVGLVLYRFAYWTSSTLSQNIGPGLLLGVGYEFARHWQIGGYWGVGYTNERERSVDWNYTHLNILVSAIAF